VDRNNVSHAYNQDALSIVKNTKEKYLSMFETLKEEIEENWQMQ